MNPEINTLQAQDVLDGQLLLLDKPHGWTSFDVVNKVRYKLRRQFGFKKLKVGHAGTLDPLATGLLIICVGKFTKKIAELTLDDKEYTGTITLGATTPSYDLETKPENPKDFSIISHEQVQKQAEKMTGDSLQTPPIFSAKQVDGKRAYESARQGKEVKLQPQPIRISEFEITDFQPPEVNFRIRCSKGTYIRTIAHDFGNALRVGGYLSALRRTGSGKFRVSDAVTPEEFEKMLNAEKTSS